MSMVDDLGDDLRNGLSDAERAGSAQGKEEPVSAEHHGWTHVVLDPLSGGGIVGSVERVEVEEHPFVVEDDPGPGNDVHAAEAGPKGERHRHCIAVLVDHCQMGGAAASPVVDLIAGALLRTDSGRVNPPCEFGPVVLGYQPFVGHCTEVGISAMVLAIGAARGRTVDMLSWCVDREAEPADPISSA